MSYIFALFVLLAALAVALAQWPYYNSYYNTHAAAYPYAYNPSLSYAYNPGYGSYAWK